MPDTSGGRDCCEGEEIYGDPRGLHSFDCRFYRRNVEAAMKLLDQKGATVVPASNVFRMKTQVRAVQWTGDNWEEVLGLAGAAPASMGPATDRPDVLEVDTLRKSLAAQPGDWVVRIGGDSFDVLTAETFAATYEVVEP